MSVDIEDVSVGFLIICHKDLDRVVTLINKCLLDKTSKAILHVDMRNSALLSELKLKYKNNPRVIFVSPSVKVYWSGFSQVEVMLELLKLGCHYECDFLCFLSGEDVLLKSTNHLKKFLVANALSFVDGNYEADYLWRVNHYNFLSDNSCRRLLIIKVILRVLREIQFLLNINRNKNSFKILKGSQWSVFKLLDAKVLINAIDESFIKKFKHTCCSDEHFFQMAANEFIPNFEFKGNLHYYIFNKGESSPRYLSFEELDIATEHESAFFARKVEANMAKLFYKKRSG